jgi:DnaJ-class molecular chaperone
MATNMKYIECRACNGKGHILDKAVMVFVPIVSWFIAAIESDDPESSTRKKCETCKGKGYRIWK